MLTKTISVLWGDDDDELEAFTDATYAWIDELRIDFERCTGVPFEGGEGILFAHDVLRELHGGDASWELFDVDVLLAWTAEHVPGAEPWIPTILGELVCFTNYVTRHGGLAPERALATELRFREHLERDRRFASIRRETKAHARRRLH